MTIQFQFNGKKWQATVKRDGQHVVTAEGDVLAVRLIASLPTEAEVTFFSCCPEDAENDAVPAEVA